MDHILKVQNVSKTYQSAGRTLTVLENITFLVEPGSTMSIVGPSGSGKTTLLGVKICAANRLPASFFVSVSYMCWAYRRQGIRLTEQGEIAEWLY